MVQKKKKKKYKYIIYKGKKKKIQQTNKDYQGLITKSQKISLCLPVSVHKLQVKKGIILNFNFN